MVTKTAAYTLKPSDSGTVFTTEGASGTVAFTLPAATEAGFQVRIWNAENFTVSITRAGSDTIELNGNTYTALTSYGKGEYVELIATGGTEWLASGSGERYVDRGNATAFDIDEQTLTMDNDWHDWDLSSIVPLNAAGKAINIRTLSSDNTANNFSLREKGSTDVAWNILNVRNAAGGTTINQDGIVVCNASRVIEYKVSATATLAEAVIRGWWVGGFVGS